MYPDGCLTKLMRMNLLADAASPLAGVVTANRPMSARFVDFRDERARRHRRDRVHARRRPSAGLPCQQHNPDLWFSDSPADLDVAKALCAECPIQQACLAGALERGEYTGVWGGEILDRGLILTHKRGPGRPRKNSEAPRRYELPAAERAAV
jgi:WhiB family transcriptional regulator, redox-sensing transcriptional regulator